MQKLAVHILVGLVVSLSINFTVIQKAEGQAQRVGIGTNTPDNSALLHLESVAKGLLIPRVTQAQMLAIPTPATGLIAYNTTYLNFYYYTGIFWTPLIGDGWSITGDAGTVAGTNFLGTIDSVDVVHKTNSRERIRFYGGGDIGLISNYNVPEKLRFYEPSGSGSEYTEFQAHGQSTTVRYRLPLADGSTGSALATDGAGNLSWQFYATIGGGGSETLWERGSGQRTLEGVGLGNKASGKYSLASGQNNRASGQYAMVFGKDNQGSGQEAVIAGGEGNDAQGNACVVGGGYSNSAEGNHTYIGGGSSNRATGGNSAILGGRSNTTSGNGSVIVNGELNSTSGQDNLLFGYGITAAGSGNVLFNGPVATETRMGIGVNSPTQALQVEGNVRFSSSLKPNNASGSAGQYLKSNGAGVSPTWGSIIVPSSNWRLLGNSATAPATNFIGTTDAEGFAIRTSNIERVRILSTGEVGIGTSTPTSQLHVIYTGTSDEFAAVYGEANSSSTSQLIGVWGSASNTSGTNTGTIGVLARGNGNTLANTTNVALEVASGELAVGRTSQLPSKGVVVEGATGGTAYSSQGPSGVIELSLQTDLNTVAPVAGSYQDIGSITVNNRYATVNSIVIANVIGKLNGGGLPDSKNSIYKIDVENRGAGSFSLHIGMLPILSDATTYQGSDYIRVGYVIINPGK